MVLEECKYNVKGKKISKYIIDDLEIYSDDSNKDFSKELIDLWIKFLLLTILNIYIYVYV